MDTDTDQGYEAQALADGWRPREQFKGDPEKWIDAETFVKRGEEVLPLVKAHNKKLKAELDATKQAVAEMRASMEEFRQQHESVVSDLTAQKKGAYEKAVADLKAARKDARAERDDDRVDELSDALTALEREKAKLDEASPKKPAADIPKPADITKTAEYREWIEEYPEFDQNGEDFDEDRMAIAVAKASILRGKNPNISLAKLLRDITAFVEDKLGPAKGEKEPPASKVEGTRRGQGGGAKSYADMPSDARAQCDSDVKRFVGENKMYKTAKEYQTYFAKLYFQE